MMRNERNKTPSEDHGRLHQRPHRLSPPAEANYMKSSQLSPSLLTDFCYHQTASPMTVPRIHRRLQPGHLLLHRHISSSLPQSFSRLREIYGFTPTPPPPPQSITQTPNSTLKPPNSNPKKEKPQYRPPSSIDPATTKRIRTTLPFDFRYSYTESSDSSRPIGLREPKYSPFGPGRIDRPWTGVCAPAVDATVRSVDGKEVVDLEEKRRNMREKIVGEPLTDAEVKMLVEKNQRNTCKKQVNLGRDGLTHNMLNDIHNHWVHSEAVRIKCMGVCTVDMENVCTQIEDKTFGKIIHRKGGTLVLYRGRNYVPKKRPVIPLMLWRPHEPIYPRLIKTTIEGLSIEETKEMRKRGLSVHAVAKLSRNGYYGSLVLIVRDAFLMDELVRIDCKGLEKSDYKKIGMKLRDLVPCILVTFDKEQIVLWRGKNYRPDGAGLFLLGKETSKNPDIPSGNCISVEDESPETCADSDSATPPFASKKEKRIPY